MMKHHVILDSYQKITGTLVGINSQNTFENKLSSLIHALETCKSSIDTTALTNQLYSLVLSEGSVPELIESCRSQLSQLMQSPDIIPPLSDIFYSTLLLLSDFAPLNDDDPIFLEKIPQNQKITLSNGNQFNIATLSQWLNKTGCFNNPLTGTFFASRDQLRIQQQCAQQGRALKPELLATNHPAFTAELDLNEIQALIESGCYYSESLTLITHYIQKNPKNHNARLLRAFIFEHQPNPDAFRALEDCIYVYKSNMFNTEAKERIDRLYAQLKISLPNRSAFIKIIASGRAHINEFLAIDSAVQKELLNNPNAVVQILNAAQIELTQLLSLDPTTRQHLYHCVTEITPLLQQKSIKLEQLPAYFGQRQHETGHTPSNTMH